MRNRVLLLASVLWTATCAPRPLHEVSVRQPLGDSYVETVAYRVPGGGCLLVNLHEDEQTSVQAALDVIRRVGGEIVKLRHSGERLIRFQIEGKEYAVDPNRIFTPAGCRATLERYSRPDPAAAEAALAFARHLMRSYGLDRSGVIITLHNNGDGGYSVTDYLPGGELEQDAEEVFLAPGADPDDFFFVTTREWFETFQAEGFNVVLQNNRSVTDDGSLSVLAARLGIPYVNLEAQHGHHRQQRRMLRVLLRKLSYCRSS